MNNVNLSEMPENETVMKKINTMYINEFNQYKWNFEKAA